MKGTECSELCGVVYVKPSYLISHAGRIGTSLYSVHVSQKVDVRDILDCDYKVTAQIIVNMVLVSSKKRQLNK